MDDLDRMFARLAEASAPSPIGDDPAFIVRLRASGEREAAMGMARSTGLGLLAAAAALWIGVGAAPSGGDGAFLYSTQSGQLL